MCDFLAVQVSNFEGQMYPDAFGGSIDYGDRVTHATHWCELPGYDISSEGGQY